MYMYVCHVTCMKKTLSDGILHRTQIAGIGHQSNFQLLVWQSFHLSNELSSSQRTL